MTDNLLKANELHLACREMMKFEDELSIMFDAENIHCISDKLSPMIEVARHLLKDVLSTEQLNGNKFSNWFFQKDTSIYQIMEELEVK